MISVTLEVIVAQGFFLCTFFLANVFHCGFQHNIDIFYFLRHMQNNQAVE